MQIQSVSDKFIKKWTRDQSLKPVIVLIGGYAGTGKSTLAQQISAVIGGAQIIPTGILRSVIQLHANKISQPELFLPSYDMHLLVEDEKTPDVFIGFEAQSQKVIEAVRSITDFMATEKQHLIIEGNHILPTEVYSHSDCLMIELYLGVRDPQLHQKMLGGITHRRDITHHQFDTARQLHDRLISDALASNKIVFWEDEHKLALDSVINRINANYKLY